MSDDNRLARLEAQLDGLIEDVTEIKLALAEYRGARKALNWLTHTAVGIGAAVATYLGTKGHS